MTPPLQWCTVRNFATIKHRPTAMLDLIGIDVRRAIFGPNLVSSRLQPLTSSRPVSFWPAVLVRNAQDAVPLSHTDTVPGFQPRLRSDILALFLLCALPLFPLFLSFSFVFPFGGAQCVATDTRATNTVSHVCTTDADSPSDTTHGTSPHATLSKVTRQGLVTP